VSGDWDIAFGYEGSDYTHDMTLVEASDGSLTGSGGYPSGGPLTYEWALTSGDVAGDAIAFTADYTVGADAVTPLTTLMVEGVIAQDGSMSGTWSDNYQGGVREGTWVSTSGQAVALGELNAEDFGVVDYDTGLGMLTGYTAGFGLTDATFEDVQSVVVELYSGDTLLQTNTATSKVGDEITGSQISSPFDVFGTFDYVTDGYWVNVREAEYGQTLIPTRVVATVTLENGLVVTAENTNLTGDPSSIFPDVVVPTTPTNKDQCKNGGWMNFTNPSFKNQGLCVSYVNAL